VEVMYKNGCLQPFAKRLAVTDLGDYENEQHKIDPNIGFTFSQLSCNCP
jgi:hypothetical protein